MVPEFKIGDKVICIDAHQSGFELTEGTTYIVEDILEFTSTLRPINKRLVLRGIKPFSGFFPERFRLATPIYKRR